MNDPSLCSTHSIVAAAHSVIPSHEAASALLVLQLLLSGAKAGIVAVELAVGLVVEAPAPDLVSSTPSLQW